MLHLSFWDFFPFELPPNMITCKNVYSYYQSPHLPSETIDRLALITMISVCTAGVTVALIYKVCCVECAGSCGCGLQVGKTHKSCWLVIVSSLKGIQWEISNNKGTKCIQLSSSVSHLSNATGQSHFNFPGKYISRIDTINNRINHTRSNNMYIIWTK